VVWQSRRIDTFAPDLTSARRTPTPTLPPPPVTIATCSLIKRNLPSPYLAARDRNRSIVEDRSQPYGRCLTHTQSTEAASVVSGGKIIRVRPGSGGRAHRGRGSS
jgi:hypothetical protein